MVFPMSIYERERLLIAQNPGKMRRAGQISVFGGVPKPG
jgi:hypothetical protein